MKKTSRNVVQSSARCSGCSRMYPWSVSEAQPINLFPLLCGDIFCRACLAIEVQKVLSSRQVPLRCCERVVPYDFIRETVVKEEDAYYSYLLDRTRNNAQMRRETQALNHELETKQPTTLTAQAPNTLDASSAIESTVLPQQNRYPSHQRHALLARKASIQSRIAATSSRKRGELDAQPRCHACSIQEGIVQIKAPCTHAFCYRCLDAKVRSYLNMNTNGDEVPASCCGKLLPLDLVQLVVAGHELTTYAKQKVKYEIARGGTKAKGGKRKAPTEQKAKTPLKKKKEVVDLTEVDERKCVSCSSQVATPDKWRVVPCGHGYCLACLKEMAKISLTNRNQIPIRCCSKEFPTEYIEAVLNRTEFGKYSRFLAERDPSSSTLQSDRDYTKVVRQNRGKQCPTCGVGVVKISGCNHMKCPLGHGFCWKCQQKRCTCGTIYGYN